MSNEKLNYKILNNNNVNEFFKTKFLDVLEGVMNNNLNNVKIQSSKGINVSNNIEEQELHKKRVLRDYIIPLAYLIYSFIYIKYYNYQYKRMIYYENKLNYDMYSFFFSHENPIIKKCNIFIYKNFVKKNNKNNKSINIIPKNELINNKKQIINFLDYIISYIKKDYDYDEILKINNEILDYFKKIKKDMNKISEIFIKIGKPELTPPTNTEYLKNFNKGGIQESLLDNQNFKDKLNTLTNPDSYGKNKNYYKIIYDTYNNILNNINEINMRNINLKIYNINHDFLDEKNIKYYDIFEKYNTYKGYKYIKTDANILEIIKLKDILENQIDNYNELFTEDKNTLNNVTLNSIINEINNHLLQNFTLTSTNIDIPPTYDLFKSLFNSLQITENIEINYLNKIDKRINIKINILPLSNIKTNKLYFNNEIKAYIKSNNEETNKKNILDFLTNKLDELKKEDLKEPDIPNSKLKNVNQATINTKQINITTLREDISQLEIDKKFIDNFENNINYINLGPIMKKIADIIKSYLINSYTTSLSSTSQSSFDKDLTEFLNLPNIDKNNIITYINKLINNTTANSKQEVRNIINEELLDNINKNDKPKYIILKNKYKLPRIDDKNLFDQIDAIQKKIDDDIILKDTKLTQNEKQFKNNLDKKYKYDFNEFSKDINKTLYNTKETNQQKIIDHITSIISQEEIKKNSILNDKKELKDKYNDIFNMLYESSEKITNIINVYNESQSKNILKIYYDKNFEFNTIIEKIIKLYNSPNKNDDRKKIIEITNQISDYFANQKDNIFINKVNELISKDELIKPFWEQYYEYYKVLIKKINIILNKINMNRMNLAFRLESLLSNFQSKIIQNKIKKKDEIIQYKSEMNPTNKSNKRGEYTIILPYTDIMFLYFIDLLIIIDYLTYFYE